ncbi:MAG: ABC-2 transporter permease [Gammaproteobacteria bacterium]|nr:MAG: ABC-2 transporter permease [Gammaproteobacteria bacterium]
MIGILRHVLALAVKEFLALVRDPRSRFVLIGPPIAQLIVFGYAATFDLDHVPVAVYNEDRGALGRALVARIAGSPHFDVVAAPDSEAALAALVDRRTVLLALHLPQDFSRNLHRGLIAQVQAILDGRNSNTAMIALNYLRRILIDFDTRLARESGHPPPPARLEMRAWYNANLSSRWFIVPGIVGLLTLVVTLVVTSLSVAREREQGTFDQLLVTPLRPAEILVGKALPGLAIGLAEGTVIISLVVFWFGVPLRGSLAALYLGLALFLLSAIGIGLMISAIAVTQQQAMLGAFLFLVPAVILSGFATPIANMPPLVQQLSLLDPLRYFLVVIRGVFLEGADIAAMQDQYWPMLLIGLVSLVVAGGLFRHRMY